MWKKHALKRMLERGLLREDVFEALSDCEIVESHEQPRPLPSFLVLGYYSGRPLHVVLAVNEAEEVLWIITTYEPSAADWLDGYRLRRHR